MQDIELYFLDWDTNARSEQVQITSATTGTVLDTATVSSFHNGVYLEWAISGNVVITITKLTGSNAVLSGLFFDAAMNNDAESEIAGSGGGNSESPNAVALAAADISNTTTAGSSGDASVAATMSPFVSGSNTGLTNAPAASEVFLALEALASDTDLLTHDVAPERVSEHASDSRPNIEARASRVAMAAIDALLADQSYPTKKRFSMLGAV